MTQTITATQKMFTLDGVTYSQMKSGYCFKTTGLKDKKGQDITRRIPEKVFDEAYEQYVNQQWDIEKEVKARKEAEEQKDRETEATFNGTKANRKEEAIKALIANWKELVKNGEFSAKEMRESLMEQINADCQGWDSSEEDLTEEIARILGYDIEDMTDEQLDEWEGIVSEAAKRYVDNAVSKAKKASKPRKSKDIAHESNGVTLTAKQVDFMNHLPDTCFWDNGLDSMPWCDVLADEIGGQFAGKPMTVGAMISTLREKGVLEVGRQKVNGRMAKYMALTEVGKQVARELGLK